MCTGAQDLDAEWSLASQAAQQNEAVLADGQAKLARCFEAKEACSWRFYGGVRAQTSL